MASLKIVNEISPDLWLLKSKLKLIQKQHLTPGGTVYSPHKGQRRGASMFPLIWINGRVNNREAGDLRRRRSQYDVTVINIRMFYPSRMEDCFFHLKFLNKL